MLPPGHIAGGYLTAKLVLGSLHYNLTSRQLNELTWFGMLFSFIPDLDFFAAFAMTKSFRIENNKVSHRSFFTHAPLAWLAVALLVFFLNSNPFYKALGLMIWTGSWTHFILDAEWGVMWLWPFSRKYYPFSESYYKAKYGAYQDIEQTGFWEHWYRVAKREYLKTSGVIELILIIIALVTALNK